MISAGYDPETLTLEIEFTGGAIYQYLNVPEEFYLGLMKAESKGQYLNFVIKPAGFEYREL